MLHSENRGKQNSHFYWSDVIDDVNFHSVFLAPSASPISASTFNKLCMYAPGLHVCWVSGDVMKFKNSFFISCELSLGCSNWIGYNRRAFYFVWKYDKKGKNKNTFFSYTCCACNSKNQQRKYYRLNHSNLIQYICTIAKNNSKNSVQSIVENVAIRYNLLSRVKYKNVNFIHFYIRNGVR